MTAPQWTRSNAWRPLVGGALLAFRPQGVFQISPQPISIGNMHTLTVFKDRKKLFETRDVASNSFRGHDRSSLASKDGLALCDMSLRLSQSPLNKIAVHAAKHTTLCIGNTNSTHPA